MEEVHKKIRILRKKTGVTLEKLGKAIGMSKGNLSRVERGDVSISIESLEKIAHFFGVPVQDLAGVPIDRTDPVVKAVIDKEAQILKMQVNTEEFIRAMLNKFIKETDQISSSDAEAMEKALELLFDLPGTEYLFNGFNTRPHYPLLELYEKHKAKRAEEKTSLLIRQLNIALGEEK